MSAEKKKKITLEDLALVTKKGFAESKKTVDKLMQEMRGGFDGVDVKIKESEKRIIKEIDTKIDTKIDELALITKRGFDAVDERFDEVDEKLAEHDGRFTAVDEKLAEHDGRFTALETAMKFGFNESKKRDEKLEAKIDKSITLLDSYVNKQESFKQEFTVVKEEIRQIKGIVKNKLGVAHKQFSN